MIETRQDRKRGCGWRKPGGLYFVAAGVGAACGRMPWPLNVCPTCNAGIKPTRGFAWIDTAALTRAVDRPCDLWYSCLSCPWGEDNVGRHGLLWVGGVFYPRPEDWTAEAKKQGVSRRISAVPKDFKLGEHWILVAHREVIPQAVVDGITQYDAAIFHAFKPTAIEYVVIGTETDEELERLEKRGVTLVKIERIDDDAAEVERLLLNFDPPPDDAPVQVGHDTHIFVGETEITSVEQLQEDETTVEAGE